MRGGDGDWWMVDEAGRLGDDDGGCLRLLTPCAFSLAAAGPLSSSAK